MEISSKSTAFKKKRKRKQKSDASSNSFAKPELFDGMSNWLNLQKVASFLSCGSKLLLKILLIFSFIPSFLCTFIYPSFHHILPSLSFIYKKVLPPEPKREKYPKSEGKPHTRPNKSYKATNKTSSSAKVSEEKTQFKSDSAERKLSCLSMESELSDHVPNGEDCVRLTKTVALDCEMVGTGPEGKDSVIARVSIVNAYSECIYDEFVKPKEKVTDFRTEISGVRPADLKKGKELYEVQQDILSIIKDRRIVGHDLKHDFDVLFISHPKNLIRDTSKYKPFREVSGGRTPSLKKLASVLLGCDIQGAEHSSVEDAQAAMLLYLRHKGAWEKSLKSKRKRN